MSGPPQLPSLPPGFGNQSSYPPHTSSRPPPPIPPLPPGVLEREQQQRAPLNRSPRPLPPPSTFSPGQIIASQGPPSIRVPSPSPCAFIHPPPQWQAPHFADRPHSTGPTSGFLMPITASQPQLGSPPSLNAPLPDIDSLQSCRDRAFSTRDDRLQVTWAKDVLKYVERKCTDSSNISEPRLVRWTDEAIGIIKSRANSNRPDPQALYIRADLEASGAFPTYLKKDLKEAFNDFDLSARLGWAASWFRIGRDYELLNDSGRARDAYQRGMATGDVGSIYRLGMANLLGQLDLPVSHAKAISMLKDAADRSDLDTPQPSYIYGMLLAGEFTHVHLPRNLLPPTRLEAEARRRIERAAFLNFAPAQYKCGWSYEYAQLDCPFDPLLSVQYYSLASQGGEIQADMALSKWFLCGAEGCFEKNEILAFTFADKAARKALPSAQFALGYYYEVGVGTEKNLEIAKKWYNKAAAHDNGDAKDRLKALQGPSPNSLSRDQHQANVDEKVERKRTQAKMLSNREGRRTRGGMDRKKTIRLAEETAGRRENHSLGQGYPKGELQKPLMDTSISSGTMPAAPGKHESGYSLTDTPSVKRPNPPPKTQQSPSACLSIPSSNYSDKKVYNTFAEMGYRPQKAKKEECVIC